MVGTRQGFKDVSRNIATALMVTGLVVGNPSTIGAATSGLRFDANAIIDG
jgi:hypothetical protein